MTTTSAGPDGVRYPGKSYDVPDHEGRELVDGGYATESDVAPAKAPAKGKAPGKDKAPGNDKEPGKDGGGTQ